jgi:hypothetical protein
VTSFSIKAGLIEASLIDFSDGLVSNHISLEAQTILFFFEKLFSASVLAKIFMNHYFSSLPSLEFPIN